MTGKASKELLTGLASQSRRQPLVYGRSKKSLFCGHGVLSVVKNRHRGQSKRGIFSGVTATAGQNMVTTERLMTGD